MKRYWLITLCVGILLNPGGVMAACNTESIRASAIQEIEYLRRHYARATDSIGQNTPESIESGRRTYHRIFTADASFGAAGMEMTFTGPDAWLDAVLGTLGPMGPTQHLIGTQTVEMLSFELDEDCGIASGSASMQSYVHAWHTLADGKIWIFVGDYLDEVVYTPGTGWQINKMYLARITEETR